jgi:hypothetical protein
MGLDNNTAIHWNTVEDVMLKIGERNKKMRIINESLHVMIKGTDPLYCYDAANERFVYIRKSDWTKASPAIRTIEACVILRITPHWFKRKKNELGIVPKGSVKGQVPGVKRQQAMVYYTVNDLIEIVRELPVAAARNSAGEEEIRKLFARGYTTYKLSRNGEFLPVWDESIY